MSEGRGTPDLLDRDLARLADDVAARAHVPGFGAVNARVRRRRRTRLITAGSALAVAATVAGLVLGPDLGGGRGRGPAPATDGPRLVETGVESGTVPEQVQQLVRSVRAHRFEVAGGVDGSLAVIWRDLRQPAPAFALVTRTADGVVTGRLLDAPLDLTAAPGGWIGTSGDRHVLVRPDGIVRDVPVSSGRVEPAPGDVAVPRVDGFAIYRSGVLSPLHTADAPQAALVASDGALVTTGALPRVDSSTGGQVVFGPGVSGINLTGNGTHVTAIALGDDPDGGLPAVGAAVSSDSGATWRVVELPADFGEITSAAVTAGGTTVLTSYGASARLLTPDGRLVTPRKPLVFEQVASAGDVVYGWSEEGLFASTDADLEKAWVQVGGAASVL